MSDDVKKARQMEPDYVYKGAVPFAETYPFNLKELVIAAGW